MARKPHTTRSQPTIYDMTTSITASSTKNDLGTSKYVYAAVILPLGLSSFNTCFSAHNELAAYYALSGQAIAKRTSRGFIHLRFARTTSTHIPAIASPTLPLRQQQHLYAIPPSSKSTNLLSGVLNSGSSDNKHDPGVSSITCFQFPQRRSRKGLLV